MRILDDIAKVKVLVVGDIMLDRYWWGSVERISPEAPVPVVRLERMSIAAGGAANVAVNLAGTVDNIEPMSNLWVRRAYCHWRHDDPLHRNQRL